MHSIVFGYQVNLIHATIIVGLYDLVHILNEFRERFIRFESFENTEFGCMSNLFQTHCMDTYGEVAVYSLDLIFTTFLIYGASRVRLNFPVHPLENIK